MQFQDILMAAAVASSNESTEPLAASVTLESYNGGIDLAEIGDGRYSAERTIAGTDYGYGVTSAAAISGDCLLECNTDRSAGLNLFVGLSTTKAIFSHTVADLEFCAQLHGATTGADGWFGASYQGALSIGNTLWIERIGEAVKFYVGAEFPAARAAGSILDGTSTGAPDLYLATLQRSPDICRLRFIAHPGV